MEVNFKNCVFVNGKIYSYGEEVETGELYINNDKDNVYRVKEKIPHTDEGVINYIINYHL